MITPDDKAIRACLRASLHEMQGGCRVVEEWDTGGSRMDVAMIATDALTGWEIKSDRDSCARLDKQARDYSDVCDIAWIVCGPKMAGRVVAKIPDWWGILVADGEPLTLTPRRPAGFNPRISVLALLFKLWCAELRELTERYGLPAKVRRMAKAKMITDLHATGRLAELRNDVLRMLLARPEWKSESPTPDKAQLKSSPAVFSETPK